MSTSQTSHAPVPDSPLKLTSWKAIANYFDCDARTAKRWERERGLPVHRMPGERRSGVFAYSSELDSWLRTGVHERDLHSEETARELEAEEGNSLSVAIQSRVGIGAKAAPKPDLAPSIQRSASRRWPIWFAASLAILLVAASLLLIHRNQQAFLESSAVRASSSALRHIPQPGAEELYLRGRYFWNLRTADSLSKAMDAYTQAIVKDPSYAEAYAGLAESYDLVPQFGRAELASSLAKAEDAANRAIALNPNLADAHAAKAFALYYGDWNIAGSDAEFERAVALDPNSSMTHHWYASTLHDRGEGPACLRQIDEALRLEPTSAAVATDAAFFQADFGNLESGLKALKEMERTQPTLSTPPDFLRAIYFARGDFPDYIAETRRYAEVTQNPDQIALADAAARGWARAGKFGLLEERARVLKVAFNRGAETGYLLGQTYVLLGRPQDALPYFNASLDKHFILLMGMQDCEWAKKLANDPGYAALFDRIRERMHGGQTAHASAAPISFQLTQ